jgi:hypothetical protein
MSDTWMCMPNTDGDMVVWHMHDDVRHECRMTHIDTRAIEHWVCTCGQEVRRLTKAACDAVGARVSEQPWQPRAPLLRMDAQDMALWRQRIRTYLSETEAAAFEQRVMQWAPVAKNLQQLRDALDRIEEHL